MANSSLVKTNLRRTYQRNVRFGSEADVPTALLRCPLIAKSGHAELKSLGGLALLSSGGAGGRASLNIDDRYEGDKTVQFVKQRSGSSMCNGAR